MNTGITILKQAGLKQTPIRNAVIEIFTGSNVALDSHEIETYFENIDRITLYRTLRSFEEKGIIHKITDSNAVIKYALCNSHCFGHVHNHKDHIHFECVNCSNTFCIENAEIPKIKMPNEFSVQGINITVTGKCKNCNV